MLDINVLVALFDTSHAHHAVAHRWFSTTGHHSWATCPITENGFVRILSNPAFGTLALKPVDAVARLRAFCAAPSHVFWSDSVSITDTTLVDLSHLQGHKQLTDLYLVALAATHSGRLASFDANIPVTALCTSIPDVVELIPTS